ncbi:antibiotic biosynthesis monooxygenase [Chitinophaga horti]|uniref:Antibiotic biosynthesis monooxygenase n=1 Tax=Chitinophaga horti TaxID=2920382 RepID=A0ABY6J7Y8_9BACT|nr:antibiotic biosynthesis monooxygenase family protein [Chitinophaga horti]UYQ95808.1 antibiotic biosynthesis monooxygenase [Chitinophaga horti]
MILRIVKMTFQPESITTFTSLFDKQKSAIRHFPGCTHLELWNELEAPHVFFTYSHWENPEALENYRNSELFRETWAATKILFAGKPEAWSVRKATAAEG